MGIKDKHGTRCARKVLGNGKDVQKVSQALAWYEAFREANIRAKPVLAEFDRIVGKAMALVAANSVPTINRTSPGDTVIARVAPDRHPLSSIVQLQWCLRWMAGHGAREANPVRA